MDNFNEIAVDQNVGGCDRFMFSDVKNVDAIPVSNSGFLTQAVVMKQGCQFFNGYASQDTLSFDETQTETNQGILYTTSIKGKYPQQDKTMLKLFAALAATRSIVTILDNNSNLRIAGTVDCGLKFTFKVGTGSKTADANQVQFEFTRQGIYPSPFYDGPWMSPGMEIV